MLSTFNRLLARAVLAALALVCLSVFSPNLQAQCVAGQTTCCEELVTIQIPCDGCGFTVPYKYCQGGQLNQQAAISVFNSCGNGSCMGAYQNGRNNGTCGATPSSDAVQADAGGDATQFFVRGCNGEYSLVTILVST